MNERLEPNQVPRRRRTRRKAATELKVPSQDIADQLRRHPVAGTDLAVHEARGVDADELYNDYANKALDDRAFTVRAVQRQIAADPPPKLDEVGGWPDEQLLAAGRAMLSFPNERALVSGVEQPPDEMASIPDPLTFASFREAISAEPRRMHSSIAETARRIRELGLPAPIKTVGAGIPASIANDPAVLDSASQGARLRTAMDAIINSPYLTQQRETAELVGQATASMGVLTNTSAIAESLARLQETTRAAQQLAAPIDSAMREPIQRELAPMPVIRPYHPEVDAIRALGKRLEAVAENEATAGRESLQVMTGQTELIRGQGAFIQDLVVEVRGLRSDQRWPNRAVIIGAFLAGALLVVGVLTIWVTVARP